MTSVPLAGRSIRPPVIFMAAGGGASAPQAAGPSAASVAAERPARTERRESGGGGGEWVILRSCIDILLPYGLDVGGARGDSSDLREWPITVDMPVQLICPS